MVGGNNVTIQGNGIANTLNGGIYLASETADPTTGDNNILVQNNTMNTVAQAGSGYSGIEVDAFDPGYPITNAVFQNNTVTNAGTDGVMTTGDVSNIAFIDTTINNAGQAAMAISGGTNIYCQGNTSNGAAIRPASIGCTGQYNFQVTGSTLTYVDCSK